MLEKSFGLLFYLKKPKNYESGEVPIYLRITVDGIEKELSTKRTCEPSRWNGKANKAAGTKEDSRRLNAYLDVLRDKTHEARKVLVEKGKGVTAVEVRDMVAGNLQRHRTLMDLFEKHNDGLKELIGKGVAKGTWINFNTSYKHTLKFLTTQYRFTDINILALDLEFIKRLYHWYKSVKHLNHNSALKNIANMKKIVLDCVDNGWLTADPFAKFEMTRDNVDTIYLEEPELQSIISKKLKNERLQRVRDVFVFCSFTGLSFIDVKQLKRSEVSFGGRGELRIYKNRQKTGTPAVIPLLPVAKKILSKYENDENCIAQDMFLPVLSNQKYNAYLKELADLCGIDKELSTKMARNTFATTVTLANNVPMETISKMMGHKSLRQTQHYAKVLAIKVAEDMEELTKRLTKKKKYSESQI